MSRRNVYFGKLIIVAVAGIIVIYLPIRASMALTASAQLAKQQTTQDLYRLCKSDDSQVLSYCYGYLEGVFDVITTLGTAMAVAHQTDVQHFQELMFTACNETTVSLGAVRQVFINWAEKHPKRWGEVDPMAGTTGLVS
jgi:hypothetical protein